MLISLARIAAGYGFVHLSLKTGKTPKRTHALCRWVAIVTARQYGRAKDDLRIP